MWENTVRTVFFERDIVLAELKHKLKYTECTVLFSRRAQFEVYGVGSFLDRHNLQHMVLVQNRHAD